jgi:hypothetical protein
LVLSGIARASSSAVYQLADVRAICLELGHGLLAQLALSEWFGTHQSNPSIIVANSLPGYVYVSTDAGHTWTKLRREFGEIRALTWMPK